MCSLESVGWDGELQKLGKYGGLHELKKKRRKKKSKSSEDTVGSLQIENYQRK